MEIMLDFMFLEEILGVGTSQRTMKSQDPNTKMMSGLHNQQVDKFLISIEVDDEV